MSIIEVKLELKKPLINYDKKPVKNMDSFIEILRKNPTLSENQIIQKCPDMTLGSILPLLLTQIQSQDSAEKLKLFRWASKIEDKMITSKGEMILDLNQVIELLDYVGRVKNGNVSTIGSILIYLDKLKEQLKSS